MDDNSNHEHDTKDIYNGINKTNLSCLICGKSHWAVLGDTQNYDIIRESPDIDAEEEDCEVVKLQCKHCGFIIEYNAKYFYDESLTKILKKRIKGKNLI